MNHMNDSHSKAMLEIFKKHGAVLDRTKKHLVWKFPDGRTFVIASSPGDQNARLNELTRLRRMFGEKLERRKAQGVRPRKLGAGKRVLDFEPAARIENSALVTALAEFKAKLPDLAYKPQRCKAALWLEPIHVSPLGVVMRRIARLFHVEQCHI